MRLKTTYNGITLDDYINSFQTLDASGRTTLEFDVVSKELSYGGSSFVSKRHKPRLIPIEFLIGKLEPSDVVEQYKKLISVINTVEPVKVSFSDEPNIYFVGMVTSIDAERPNPNYIHGTINVECLDAMRHSTVKKEFVASLNANGVLELNIENDGNVEAPIDYEIQMNSKENGYFGIVSDNGAMEFGNREEADSEVFEKSVELFRCADSGAVRTTFQRSSSTLTTGNHIVNSDSNSAFEGSYGWATMKDNTFVSSKWHGFGGRKTITPVQNFELRFKPLFATHKRVQQTGIIEVVVGDEDGAILCDMHILKSSTANNIAKLFCKIQGQGDVKTLEYEPTSTGSFTRLAGGECVISKTGAQFKFSYNGNTYSFNVQALKDKKAASVNIFIGNYGSNTETVYYLGIQNISMLQTKVQYTEDIPNRYRPYDLIEINGDETTFSVNGSAQMQDEIIGSHYFKAKANGTTQVNVTLSSFCNIKPSVKAYIRERWL